MRVLKFGGKSLSSTEKIDRLAQKVAAIKKDSKDTKIIVVVSAMGESTSELESLAQKVSPLKLSEEANREKDMLLGAGERVSAALFSLALQKHGAHSLSFTGSQAGVLTKGPHNDATIDSLKPFRIDEALEKGQVPVIAGFQGVNPQTKDVTTLGRGGSDLTAMAFAWHYRGRAELYKTVGAVHSCDPTIVDTAIKLKSLDPLFLDRMSQWGAKILNHKASKFLMEKSVKASFFSDDTFKEETKITPSKENIYALAALDSVIAIETTNLSIAEGASFIEKHFKDLPYNSLASAFDKGSARFLLHIKADYKNFLNSLPSGIELLSKDVSCVSFLTHYEMEKNLREQVIEATKNLSVKRLLETPKRLSFFLPTEEKESALKSLHKIIEIK